jgi:hypothetical protein
MKVLYQESGNVILETVFAILIFGGVLIPASVSLVQFASLNQQLQDTAFVVARAWSKSDMGVQTQVVEEMSRWYERQRGFKVTYKCVPACNQPQALVKVTVKKETGIAFLPTIIKSASLERNFYAE